MALWPGGNCAVFRAHLWWRTIICTFIFFYLYVLLYVRVHIAQSRGKKRHSFGTYMYISETTRWGIALSGSLGAKSHQFTQLWWVHGRAKAKYVSMCVCLKWLAIGAQKTPQGASESWKCVKNDGVWMIWPDDQGVIVQSLESFRLKSGLKISPPLYSPWGDEMAGVWVPIPGR